MDSSGRTIKSNYNANTYTMYEDKIEVTRGSQIREIALPIDPSRYRFYQQFHDIYYINGKLFAIVATGSSYDMRFEIDEEQLVLKDDPIPTC